MKWLKSRCNRDNFWNLMFWVGISLSASFVDLFANFIPILALIFFILTISIVPYFLAKANRVKYSENKIFFNKQGQSLGSRYPKMFGLVFILNVPVSIQLFFSANKLLGGDFISAYIAIILFLPTLYFILKNCPISILFHKQAWCKPVTGITPMSKDNFAYVVPQENPYTSLNPYYRSRATNIHHRT